MDLRLYNTLSRKKEVFKPIKKGRAGIYTCGPTVYSYAHIGNFRSFVFADVLRRVLEKFGLKTKQVMNITDVGHLVSDEDTGEDKLEKAARAEKRTAKEIASFYESDFLENFTKLNADTGKIIFPRASEHIKEQIGLIKSLEKKGFTYKISDGIYFDTSKFKNYGKLAKIDSARLKKGARVAFNPEKRNASDFALWKFSKPEDKREQEWSSPWGVGFPGWHAECSAMSIKHLGKHFDIHTGGIDLIPVHHTNEIAQSEGLTGKKFVNFWLHPDFVKINGEKMSKSLGNIITPKMIEEKIGSLIPYRYWLLSTHYRKIANFNWDALEGARKSLEKLNDYFEVLGPKIGKTDKKYLDKFISALSDDLNTPKALSILWGLVKDRGVLPESKKKTILEFDEVLGLGIGKAEKKNIPENILKMAEEREAHRRNKNWGKSDELRREMEKSGYFVEDLPSGYKIKRK